MSDAVPAPSAPMVRFDNVAKRYGALTVLDDLCLDIARGEKVSIIGPSGSGKTTVLRMLMTLEIDQRRRHLGRGRAAYPHAAGRPARPGRPPPTSAASAPRSAWSSSPSTSSRI